MTNFTERHRIEPGHKIKLDDVPTEQTDPFSSKAEAREHLRSVVEEMQDLQYRLFAEQKQSLLIVLQAPDAAGKDGTIRKVLGPLNPQGVKTHPFKVPSSLERSHDFLWRIHNKAPAQGDIAVFNRSHYEDVLVVRVEDLAPEDVWRRRYDHINHFESLLIDRGTRILKFYLHISRDEQLERFGKRLADHERHWKLNAGDYAARQKWDQYRDAYEDAIERCNSKQAPWHVIPADKKYYRDVAVAEIIRDTLRKMDPQYPPVEADIDEIRRLYKEHGGKPVD